MKKKIKNRTWKKNMKTGLSRWTKHFFLIGLGIMVSLVGYIFREEFVQLYNDHTNKNTPTQVVVNTPKKNNDDGKGEVIHTITPEQVDNIVNAEANRHAVWPGYRGDLDDNFAIRKHFSENFAKYLKDNTGIDTGGNVYKGHYYYAVNDDGVIAFVGVHVGDYTTAPKYVTLDISKIIGKGIQVIPGTGNNGKPITIIYEIKIIFRSQ